MTDPIFALLLLARQSGASDLIIGSQAYALIKKHGRLSIQDQVPPLDPETVMRFLELISYGSIHNFRQTLLAEKDLDFSVEHKQYGRFRVNAFLTTKGASCVIRFITEEIPTFHQLELPEEQFRKFTELPNGLVLFTGAMGSGKSTSMASVIEYINQHSSKHIITIEDPIEYRYTLKQSLIQQREVPMHSKSFLAALRGAVRESADVILLGELRDLETISMALTAAETGTLVFASLHTAGASHAIERIVDVFPADRQEQIKIQLSQMLRAVVWQMLLPRADGKGVVPAVEVLLGNHALANLVRKGKTYQIPTLIETSAREGMVSMRHSVQDLLRRELITREIAEDVLTSIKGIDAMDMPRPQGEEQPEYPVPQPPADQTPPMPQNGVVPQA